MKTLLTPCKWAPLVLLGVLATAAPAPAQAGPVGARLGQLEQDAALLRQQVQQQEQVLQALGAQPVTQPPLAAWAVGAAALFAFAGAAWFARRQASGGRWPDRMVEPTSEPVADSSEVARPVPAEPAAVTEPPPDPQPRPAALLPVLRAEGLQALQQQADFFLSLGRTDDAVQLFDQHLHDGADLPSHAWLELLDLYRRLGNARSYEHLAQAYGQRFGVPPAFGMPGDDPRAALEDHPSALADVQAAWLQPQVLEAIDAVLAVPPEPGAAPMSLEAGRELLWLHQIAQELAAEGRACQATLDVWLDLGAGFECAPRSGFGVDIDLDALAHARDEVHAVRVKEPPPKALDTIEWDCDLFDAATGFERRQVVTAAGAGARG